MPFNYLNDFWKKSHSLLKEQGNYRSLFSYYKFKEEQAHCIDFSSNDYLNLRNDPRIIAAGYLSAQKSGAGSGASRMVIQTDPCLEELEAYFSKLTGYSHALFFHTGFTANISLFDTLSPFAWETEKISQEFFIDHRCHSSIFFGFRSAKLKGDVFRHGDYSYLEAKLKNSTAQAKIIVIESLYSMDGDFSDANRLLNICREFNAVLIIDESHTFGTFGESACWISNFPDLKQYVLASVFGCGKAVGVSGGFISTDHSHFKERILQKSRLFIYSTAVSPFITGAVKKSLEIIFSHEGKEKRNNLNKNIYFFKKELNSLNTSNLDFNKIKFNFNLHQSNIFPLIYGDNFLVLEKEKLFLKHGLLVKAIRPPSVPKGTARIRVVLRSGHSLNDINYLLSYLC